MTVSLTHNGMGSPLLSFAILYLNIKIINYFIYTCIELSQLKISLWKTIFLNFFMNKKLLRETNNENHQ